MRGVYFAAMLIVAVATFDCNKCRPSRPSQVQELKQSSSVTVTLAMGHPVLERNSSVTLKTPDEILVLVEKMDFEAQGCMCTTQHTIIFTLKDGRKLVFNYVGQKAREHIEELFNRKHRRPKP